MFRILVTDHPAPTTHLEAGIVQQIGGELVIAERGDEEELVSLVGDADAILTCFRLVSPAVVRAGPKLRTIARYGVGVDNIAVDTATELGIVVSNVPVYCVDEVAEHAIALLMTLVRKTVVYDADVRAGGWQIGVGMPIHRLAGSTLGVVGFGHIGRGVTSRSIALGMRVLVADPTESAKAIRAAGAVPRSLDELLAEADAVTLHVPLRPETRHLIDASRLGLMKAGAFLINCARGGIVDHDALADALATGHLAGAGLDVFEPERLPADHRLVGLRNTVLTPHVAYYSEESIEELQRRAAANVVAVLTGREPENVVNPGPGSSGAGLV